MNLHFVQRDALWGSAPKALRSEFIEAMRDKSYSAEETKIAWDWFSLGWAACVLFGKKDAS